ncbi:hypothetical protein F9L16_06900 [Agarivorans sp. B2Z047]|uniref:hypothetical protein n=1 Tax=Agarivorans sp. B2Z047 TaxID=2652721 RepID=UPI00128B91C8|nr:hypothetical protein [Agarivorans sp. B2Z047]MPW28731.1 hypothetical protein [Agarivorans sp. B2Z047]UQN41292.1 hypothetical protein LQZ07_16105 [Agarivorans sp. B2Z047]
MKYETLYLHIGWSKTGTSAIQYHLNENFSELSRQGILYSKTLQMNDQAHHHFALAFSPIHGYPAKYSVPQVLDLVDDEMLAEQCCSALISSELSPFYLANPKFNNWVKKFERVEVIATIRQQSEVFLSLYNQLIKDPQVRLKASFFQLAINNFQKFNYFTQLNRWAKVLGKENVTVLDYDKDIVDRFLSLFKLKECSSTTSVINKSLPIDSLSLIQQRTRNVNQPGKYKEIVDSVLEEIDRKRDTESANSILVTKGELAAIDNFFTGSNRNVFRDFVRDRAEWSKKKYSDIWVY